MPAIQSTSNVYSTALSSSSVALTNGAILALMRRRMSDMDGQVDGLMQELENNTSRSEYIQQQSDVVAAIKQAATDADPSKDAKHILSELQVTWEGETMSAADLLNRYDVVDLADVNGDKPKPYTPAELAQKDAAVARLETSEFDDRARAVPGGYGSMEELNEWMRLGREGVDPEVLALVDDYNNAVAATELDSRVVQYAAQKVSASSFETCLNHLKSQSRLMNSGNEVLMVQLQSTMQQRSQILTLATQMMKSLNDGMDAVARNVG